jgi:predicted SnoaL-like aldol condensation-catalyzing enzyme
VSDTAGPATSGRAVSAEEARNRDVAVAYPSTLINEPARLEEALSHIGDRYTQHNPDVPDGPDGIRAFMSAMHREHPGMRTEVERAFVDGDHVILHSHGTFGDASPGDPVMDAFLLEDGQVVEHWDVVQRIPAQARSENTMF